MKLSIIAAVADDMAIGRRGDQPFYIKDDLRRFKQLTSGHTVIMGRKTFEALPRGPLPNRRNIIVSRNPGYAADGAETVMSLDEALASDRDNGDEAFVIGGGQLYRRAMDLADTLFITRINAVVPDADTFFPPIDPEKWRLAEQSDTMTDPANGVTYTFCRYTRITEP